MWTWETTRTAGTITTSSYSSSSSQIETSSYVSSTSATALYIPNTNTNTVLTEFSVVSSSGSGSQATAYSGSSVGVFPAAIQGFEYGPATFGDTQIAIGAQTYYTSTESANAGGVTSLTSMSTVSTTISQEHGRTFGLNTTTITAVTNQSGLGTATQTSVSVFSLNTVIGGSIISKYTSFSTQNGVTHSATASGVLIPFNVVSFAFSYTTTTSTATSQESATVTSTRESAFMSSTSSTETTTGTPTSTTYATTTTGSSADTFTSSAFSTETVTITTYASTTSSGPVQIDTIASAATTDWAWSLSTTGTDDLTAIGASFTQATFSTPYTFGSVSIALVAQGAAQLSTTLTTTAYATASITSTTYKTLQYTYQVGVLPTATTTGVSSALTTTLSTTASATTPLGSLSTASVTYTVSTSTSFDYYSSTTGTEQLVYWPGASFLSTFSLYLSTTCAGAGTYLSPVTSAIPTQYGVSFTGTSSLENSSSTTASTSYTTTNTVGRFTVTTMTSNVSVQIFANTIGVTASSFSTAVIAGPITETIGATPSFTDTTIGQGWQETPSSFGSLQSIGTNISGVAALTGQALGWPQVSVAVLPSTVTDGIAGAVPTTLNNEIATSAVGGFGWNSTKTTTVSLEPGIYNITTCDSFSNTGTSQITFLTPQTSTITVSPGQGIAAQSVPLIGYDPVAGTTNFLAFPAFPVTT